MLKVEGLKVLNLAPVTMELGAGECATLEGPSGSGKSLLLRALADLDPAPGTARLDGISRDAMSGPQWRTKVRYFSAEPGWWAEKVGDHVTDKPSFVGLLTELGLGEEALGWSLDRASTGEKQRMALARGLVDRPKVLLLDEPTGPLDRQTAGIVERLIQRRVAEGDTALVVTHDTEQAARLAKRHFVIRDSAVVEDTR